MRSLLVLVALAVWPICSFSAVPDCFLGRWKSDEALTLADMRKHPEVTDKARTLFERKFFGKLILVFGSRYIGGYFEGELSQTDDLFQQIVVVESGDDWVKLRSRFLGTESIQHWKCEGGRIFTEVTKWQFREYFSPLP